MLSLLVNEALAVECRKGCGACCIAPLIKEPFFGMPNGKKAGERCAHLNDDNLCRLFGRPERPAFCESFEAEKSMCGDDFAQAMEILSHLEESTAAK